jgi:putative flavoprotein involved in K+ transport
MHSAAKSLLRSIGEIIAPVHTVVIGAGQSGLSVGYYLAQRGHDFIILDQNARVGDAWRTRWDSLRLFTPARYDGLAGMPFPADPHSFPTKNEMADFLEAYAQRFSVPVRTGVKVETLTRQNGKFVVATNAGRFEADNVVVAMSSYQTPRIPDYARELSPTIRQLHSSEYRRPSQFQTGDVLVVGAGNSGAEIALEAARNDHRTWLAGRDVGHVPFRIDSAPARLVLNRLVLRFVFHRVLTVDTPIGRRARPKMLAHSGPLIRTRPEDLSRAGVKRVARLRGAKEGKPLLDDGKVMDVSNIVWCTGFDHGMSWLDLPVFDEQGLPKHTSGICVDHPGLYFVGLHFLHSLSSTMIHGAERDAKRIADAIETRMDLA